MQATVQSATCLPSAKVKDAVGAQHHGELIKLSVDVHLLIGSYCRKIT